MKKNIKKKSLKHKERYNIVIGKRSTVHYLRFYNKSVGTFTMLSYSVHVCISHYLYVFKIVVSQAAKPVAPVAQRMENPV